MSTHPRTLRDYHVKHIYYTMVDNTVLMFWPGMNSDIQQVQDECKTCRQTAPQPARLPPHPSRSLCRIT